MPPRIPEDRRRSLTTRIVTLYQGGDDIRTIAASVGYSYGLVHKILAETDTPMRPVGAHTRPRPPARVPGPEAPPSEG